DLELDVTGGHRLVHGVRRTGHDLPRGAYHELVPDPVGHLRRLGRALRVDDELADSAAVAEVDEHEAAVVASARDPAREREPFADMLRPRLAAQHIAPRAHGESLRSTLSCGTVSSASPWRRRTASSLPTITVVAAPRRADCV